jgi:hypothetical protein
MANTINIKDVDALEDFHRHLVQFNQTLENEYRSFAGHLAQVNGVWDDPMYHRLVEALEDAFRGIEAYLHVAPEPDGYLNGLIHELQAIQSRFGG